MVPNLLELEMLAAYELVFWEGGGGSLRCLQPTGWPIGVVEVIMEEISSRKGGEQITAFHWR